MKSQRSKIICLLALIQQVLLIRSDYDTRCESYPEKIDAIITWVNGSDPWFMKGKDKLRTLISVWFVNFEQNMQSLMTRVRKLKT